RMQLVIRFDYGSIVPWVRRVRDGIVAVARPDGLLPRSPGPLRGENFPTVADFAVGEGEQLAFDLTWFPSHETPAQDLDHETALKTTLAWWSGWSSRCTMDGPWRDAVVRSLVTLKTLMYRPTGAFVAAPTTSLPEKF